MYQGDEEVSASSTLVSAQSYNNAILNILDDVAEERSRLEATQTAILNILEDSGEEKLWFGNAQRAIINILEDASTESEQVAKTQQAILNLLDDAADEKFRLVDLQRAALNILDDFDVEKQKVTRANDELRNEIIDRLNAEAALLRAHTAIETANRELETFSYSVAHDLRAPLRSIDGFSLALLEDCAEALPQDGAKFLGYIRDSAQHMARLIDDLLSLSRIGKSEIHLKQVDLVIIARRIFARFQRDQPHRSVELATPLNLVVVGDSRLLELAVENLLSNAWKFSKNRERANIEIGQTLQDDRTVYFIRDNGAGFDMAYAEKLFAAFQRLHSVGEFEGTGVGLANVERIIHRHGGRIWAESKVNFGATFYFTLGVSK